MFDLYFAVALGTCRNLAARRAGVIWRPRRRLFLVGLAFCVAAAAALSASSAAFACAASPNSAHCYGTATYTASGTYDGGRTNITASSLTNSGQAGDFITAEIWLDDNAAHTNWTETGAITGHGGSRRWFWADQCDGIFMFHGALGLSFSLGTTYEAKISYNNGGKYAVYRDGSFIANSQTCHNATASDLITGGETTFNTDIASATSTAFARRLASNASWSTTWPGATKGTVNTPAWSVSWIIQYSSISYSH